MFHMRRRLMWDICAMKKYVFRMRRAARSRSAHMQYPALRTNFNTDNKVKREQRAGERDELSSCSYPDVNCEWRTIRDKVVTK